MAEGFSEWLPVISTLAGGVLAFGAALVVNKVNHRYALEREARAATERQRHEMKVAQDKLERERYFISTELIFQLERFGEDCVAAAWDYGEKEDESGIASADSDIPSISFSAITGDWRALPPPLMFRIRELDVQLAESRNALSIERENDAEPHLIEFFFWRRRYATRLGIKAFLLAAKLRKLNGIPKMKGTRSDWFAPRNLWKQYCEQREILSHRTRSGLVLAVCIIAKIHERNEKDLT